MMALYVSSHRSAGNQVHVGDGPSAAQRDGGGHDRLSARGAGGGAYALKKARRSALITSSVRRRHPVRQALVHLELRVHG